MASFEFVALCKKIDQDRGYKVPHVSVAFTVSGWKNSWNTDCTEYMDVSGILSEEKASLILAAPDLLNALKALIGLYDDGKSWSPEDHPVVVACAAIQKAEVQQ